MHDIRERIRDTRPDADELPPLDLPSIARRARRRTVAARGVTAVAAVAVLGLGAILVDLLPERAGVDIQPAVPGTEATGGERIAAGWTTIAPGSLELTDVEAVLADPADIEVVAELDAERWAPHYFVAFDATPDGEVVAYDPVGREVVVLGADGDHRPLADVPSGAISEVTALQVGPDRWTYLVGAEDGGFGEAVVRPLDRDGDPQAAWVGEGFWNGILFVGDTGWVQVDADRWVAIARAGSGMLTTHDVDESATPPDGMGLRYDYAEAPPTSVSTYTLDSPYLDEPSTWDLDARAFNGWASPHHHTIPGRRLVVVDQHAGRDDGLDSLALVFDADGTLFGLRIDVGVAPAFDGIGTSPAKLGSDGRLYWMSHRDDGTVEIARYRHPLPPPPLRVPLSTGG